MSKHYTTIQNDRMDKICKRFYGTEHGGNVEAVYDVNPGVAEIGNILPPGIVLLMPDRPQTLPLKDYVRLWD